MAIYPLSKTILLLGDSITQMGVSPGGISQLLSATYIRRLDVVNRGYGGYNSEWLLEVAKQMVVPADVKVKGFSEVALVVVWIGANDAADAKLNPRQHCPLPDYIKNVTAILELFPPTTPKILITSPPVQEARFNGQITSPHFVRTASVTKAYAEAMVQLGKELGVPVIDLFAEFGKVPEKEWDPLFIDGLHITAAGYQIVYNALMRAVLTTYPQLNPETMERPFPLRDDVDLNDVAGSLKYKG